MCELAGILELTAVTSNTIVKAHTGEVLLTSGRYCPLYTSVLFVK